MVVAIMLVQRWRSDGRGIHPRPLTCPNPATRSWQRGEPEPLKFLGMSSGSIKAAEAENQLNVTAKRCTRCGYLKLYALPKTD